jgi:hypothetical protein
MVIGHPSYPDTSGCGAYRAGWVDAWERLCLWGASASVAVCLFAFVNQSLPPEPNPFDVLIEEHADPLDRM